MKILSVFSGFPLVMKTENVFFLQWLLFSYALFSVFCVYLIVESNRFIKQNNNYARAVHSLVHFFATVSRLQRETSYFYVV